MVHVSGLRGELRAGYQRAAVLGAWTIEPSSERPNTFIFQAVVAHTHAVWLQHRPMALVLSLGTTEWVWQGVEPTIEGADVMIALTTRPEVTQTRGTR